MNLYFYKLGIYLFRFLVFTVLFSFHGAFQFSHHYLAYFSRFS
jgi:hypothetical protein